MRRAIVIGGSLGGLLRGRHAHAFRLGRDDHRAKWSLEGKGMRTPDPITFMRENGGVETSNRADDGLFFRLLAKTGFA
jgi:hypothetical protein